ncbi:MAG: CBS domain-containing protein [Nanoarchaeota archaeon]
MIFDISQLKKIRKQLDLTQHQFAQKIGISQSMIAKIESGKLDPTYSYVKKIEQAIESLSKDEELKAEDVMTKKIIFVREDTKIKEIITIFAKHEISQVPVIEKNIPLGLVTESTILALDNDISTKVAGEIMIESPPIVSKSSKLSVIKSLLQFYPIILIKESEKLVGVITKSDIIKHLIK